MEGRKASVIFWVTVNNTRYCLSDSGAILKEEESPSLWKTRKRPALQQCLLAPFHYLEPIIRMTRCNSVFLTQLGTTMMHTYIPEADLNFLKAVSWETLLPNKNRVIKFALDFVDCTAFVWCKTLEDCLLCTTSGLTEGIKTKLHLVFLGMALSVNVSCLENDQPRCRHSLCNMENFPNDTRLTKPAYLPKSSKEYN